MTVSNEETEDIGVWSTDSSLEPYKEHFKDRVKRYLDQKSLFEKFEGDLEEFAQGDFYFMSSMLFPFGLYMDFLEYVEGCWIMFILYVICDCLDDIIFLKKGSHYE